jgi:SanA protein
MTADRIGKEGGGLRKIWAVVKLLAGAAIFSLLAASAASSYVRYGPHAHIAPTIEAVAPARAGLVLGTGRIRGAGEVSPIFQARMETAARLYRAGKIKFLVVSGYRISGGRATQNYDEPEDMRETLVAMGVPAERIYRDDRSYRTFDSVTRAACVFGPDRVLLISQADHVARALFLAWAFGLDADGIAAADPPRDVAERNRRNEALARLLALFDIFASPRAPCDGAPVVLGRDSPG